MVEGVKALHILTEGRTSVKILEVFTVVYSMNSPNHLIKYSNLQMPEWEVENHLWHTYGWGVVEFPLALLEEA